MHLCHSLKTTDMVAQHTILYVDDDPDDFQMLQEAIQKLDGRFHIVEATDGRKGLTRLQHMKITGKLPCLIILDINMPGMGGKEAYNSISTDDILKNIPVVILSTSSSDTDKNYFEGRNVEYITKPVEFTQLVNVAARLLHYCKN
ncbi:MAG TPA: response regulator [Chitinophagaceae bacterium]|nr:response regulator [Chitinophagaceae bacterium]